VSVYRLLLILADLTLILNSTKLVFLVTGLFIHSYLNKMQVRTLKTIRLTYDTLYSCFKYVYKVNEKLTRLKSINCNVMRF